MPAVRRRELRPARTPAVLRCTPPEIRVKLTPRLAERGLDLHDTAVTDEGLKSLAAMHSLRRLNLSGTRATAAGIAELKSKLPRCRIE
jgi:hypothetical protein